MKIAIVVSMFPPKWIGGTEIATKNTAKYLALRGNIVHVITSLDKGLPKQNQEDGYFVHRVLYPKIKFLGVIFFWIKCSLVIQKIRPEIAHSQSIQMAPACLLAKIFFNVPYIIYCRGFDVYLDWKFKKIISKLVLRDAGAIVTLTEDMKRKVQIICDKNIFVIPNGIEQKRFQNLLRDDIRNKLKIRKNEKIIFFAGTLKLVKGIRYLIEAINIIKQKIPEARLLLVGDGEEDENLKKLVRQLSLENYVIFFGKVSNEEIPKYMVASDIFVLPSLSESFGIVNIEAMASGLPIIATKVGGIPEIIKDGENGFLVEPKNPEQIAERILYLLSNNNIRRSISFNNKEKAKNYSWDLIVNKLIAVYSLCLNKN